MVKSKSGIEWTDVTWNPSRGCREVSPGCAHCYAKTFAERFRGVPGHPYEQGFDLRLVAKKILEPLKYKAGTKVFVNSMSDLFFEDIPDDFVASVFGVMALRQDVTFQVLTKRAGRMRSFLDDGPDVFVGAAELVASAAEGLRAPDGGRLVIWDPRGSEAHRYMRAVPKKDLELRRPWPGWPLPNVWIGVSVEDQKRADSRIRDLLQTQAAGRFISAEPLLGPLNLIPYMGGRSYRCPCGFKETENEMIFHGGDAYVCPDCNERTTIGPTLDWVIVGGESGPRRRPMSLEWARAIRGDCFRTETPFFFKQIDKKTPIPADLTVREFPGGPR